ncbi:MAG: hypothetical protein DRG39_07480 [Deltaproteobacteria bacterium]|nr:MAG: hypothetical protein DRG39_07480 [Deltaproteobacteria bacterium]
MKKIKKDFLKYLLDIIDYRVAIVDKEMVIHYGNKRFITDYGIKNISGKKCYEVIYGNKGPCNTPTRPCPLIKAIKTQQAVRTIHKIEDEKGVKDILIEVYPITYDEQCQFYAIISTQTTGYQDLINKIRTAEERFKVILDTATDAILSINKEHKIILFNNAAERIFGYSKEEIMGEDLNILVPSYYGDHSIYVKRFLKTRRPNIMGKTVMLNALRKNGEEFPIELSLSYMELNGDVTFTAIIRDVSGQKQMERKLLQSERLAAVGKAVAHVAHEIKNPLMIIGGFSQQIKNHITDEKSLKKIDMILDEVARLERLIANLGDFTKEYRLIKRPSDINSVINDVLKMMKEIYPKDRYAFVAQLSKDVPEIICDPDKLKQVFINIITNAVQAMEKGGTVTVITERWTEGVQIMIQDEGKGMSEEELLHIFEPFYTTRDSGSGLGLAISYRIVEAHKGEIKAISSPGKGTTFIIRLPSI